MDPSVAKAISEVLGPFLGLLALGGIPVALVFLSKHFKLRTRELELEAELHGRESQARLQAMETRLSGLESAIGSLVQTFGQRHEFAPPAPRHELEPSRDAPETPRLVAPPVRSP